MKSSFYLLIVLGALALAAGTAALINNAVNPYGFYRVPYTGDIFPVKTEGPRRARMVKAHMVRLLTPEIVILGSSRAEYGVDPAHRAFAGKTAYNASLPGTNLYEVSRMLSHAHAAGRLQQIVLLPDFFMFDDRLASKPDFSEDRLLTNPDGTPNTRLNSDRATLIAGQTVIDSALTVLRQSKGPGYMENGFRTGTDRDAEAARLGPQGVFDRVSADFRARNTRPLTISNMEKSFALFQEMVDFCRDKKIGLIIALAPLHERYREDLAAAGQAGLFREWRRRIAKTAANDIAFYDFTAKSPVSREKIPGDTKAVMNYFWEQTHYKPRVGDMMLDVIFFGQRNELGGAAARAD